MFGLSSYETSLHRRIHTGMAKAFFADGWMNQHDEACASEQLNLAGVDIMTILPEEIDSAATMAATELMIRLGGMHAAKYASLVLLFIDHNGGLEPELWGHYCAMQAMGHGVGLHDYGIDLEIPHVECPEMAQVYFSTYMQD